MEQYGFFKNPETKPEYGIIEAGIYQIHNLEGYAVMSSSRSGCFYGVRIRDIRIHRLLCAFGFYTKCSFCYVLPARI